MTIMMRPGGKPQKIAQNVLKKRNVQLPSKRSPKVKKDTRPHLSH